MQIVRYADRATRHVHVGVERDGIVRSVDVASMSDLLTRRVDEIRSLTERPIGDARSVADLVLLPPVDGRMEVWAAGVTYERSKDARIEESLLSQAYELVYAADRPELFFKSLAWRVVTGGEPVAIRADSASNVPEAELALVVNAFGDVVGYTICNDMSSRSIEGANPIYLPQAKIYAGSCALAAGVRPAWEVADPLALGIRIAVVRGDTPVWTGSASTADLRRSFGELIGHLFEAEQFPEGVVLSTGTGTVPPLDFTLQSGDVVTIAIDQIGTLANWVTSGKGSFEWLADANVDPSVRDWPRHSDRSWKSTVE